LVIIDEQHKFGVLQRKKLYEKTFLPDILIMTATPIPRSLAMTLYGELDISVLDQLPPGRKPVKTIFYNNETEALKFVLERLSCGEKVYIVYPVIEENKLELKSLIEEYNKLSLGIFKNYSCGLLHGKMKSLEKKHQMLKFKNGEYRILFSTTVIEVGVDVYDATVILINHVERFGLATLHQLRGRVGRGEKQSYCILLGNLTTQEAQQRVQVMLETNDGFKIAQKDLEIRGPGEIFGTVQHGKNEIDYSDVIKYSDILMKSRFYAKSIVLEKKFVSKQINELLTNLEVKNSLGTVG
jgi:ATP-dependent DNA helicase RecG